MKIYLSADIEGITGSTHWDEVHQEHPEYAAFRKQMTAEVAAACQGALAAGATEILVKDAHATGRNIIAEELPEATRLIRGWSGHPLSMIQELDESFQAVVMIGYHSRAGSGGNPLAHTMISSKVHTFKINNRLASEFLLHGYAAARLKVPVVFVSGDADLGREVQEINPRIRFLAVKEGHGDSTISIHPRLALTRIREGVTSALQEDPSQLRFPAVETYRVEIQYVKQQFAYRASFYPGVELVDPHTIRFETGDYFEVMRLKTFVL